MTRPLVVTFVFLASTALAQGKTLKDKEEIKFNEIERGFTIEAAAGWAPIFNMPGNQIEFGADGKNVGCKRAGASLSNQVVRVELGADIGSRGDDPRSAVPLLVVTAMVQAGQARAGSDYLGTSSQAMAGNLGCQSTAVNDEDKVKSPTGDVGLLGAGLAAKVNIIGFADSQDVKRLWVYGRVAGGVNFFFPREIIKQTDVMLQAGAGVEYYTRLRHFAIGLEANFQMLFVTSTFGVTLTPTLRYSF